MYLPKKLKILTHRAHCGHQFELWKLPCNVTMISGLGDNLDSWDFNMRPLPVNAKFTHYSKLDKDYDLIICHFDENALEPRHPKVPKDWATNFRYLLENFKDTPKIAICHGTPQFLEQGDLSKETVTILEDRKERLVTYLNDVPIVCNSYLAEKQWNFKNSRTIWQGFDPNDFSLGTREKGILTINEKALEQRPHYRGYFLYHQIKNKLNSKYLPQYTSIENPKVYSNSQDYAIQKYENYKKGVGSHSVFLNTTILSPMPRTRGEAMMLGLTIVTTPDHDANMFITHGENGYIIKDIDETSEILKFLVDNNQIAQTIGNKGRETAIKFFSVSRYLDDWTKTLQELFNI